MISATQNPNELALVEFASTKLLGGKSLMFIGGDVGKITHSSALAVLSCRTALFVPPSSRMASSLVSQNMALCLGFNKERTCVHTYFSSEPLLVEGAAYIMNQGAKYREFLFAVVVEAIRNGTVFDGFRGNFLSRISIVFAWDAAARMEPPKIYENKLKLICQRPISIRNFLAYFINCDGDYGELLCRAISEQVEGGAIVEERLSVRINM